MKINANGKSGLIIGIVSVATGAVIYGGSKLIGFIKNRKKEDETEEIPKEEVTEAVEEDQKEEKK